MSLGFSGQFEYRVDNKGRLPLPPKFRAHLREGVVLALGLEQCISIYPLSQWEKVQEQHASLLSTRAKWRRLNRFTFGGAFDSAMDAQGRIVLPQPLRQYARITEAVVLVGANEYLELWDKELWQKEEGLAREQASQILEGLERRDQ